MRKGPRLILALDTQESKKNKIKISRTGGEYASACGVLGDQRICQVLRKVMRSFRN